MSHDDISPSSLPLTARMREHQAGLRDYSHISIEAVRATNDYIDLAKRMLLEHRVRDFTAADVVALAAIMSERDLATQITDEGV